MRGVTAPGPQPQLTLLMMSNSCPWHEQHRSRVPSPGQLVSTLLSSLSPPSSQDGSHSLSVVHGADGLRRGRRWVAARACPPPLACRPQCQLPPFRGLMAMCVRACVPTTPGSTGAADAPQSLVCSCLAGTRHTTAAADDPARAHAQRTAPDAPLARPLGRPHPLCRLQTPPSPRWQTPRTPGPPCPACGWRTSCLALIPST